MVGIQENIQYNHVREDFNLVWHHFTIRTPQHTLSIFCKVISTTVCMKTKRSAYVICLNYTDFVGNWLSSDKSRLAELKMMVCHRPFSNNFQYMTEQSGRTNLLYNFNEDNLYWLMLYVNGQPTLNVYFELSWCMLTVYMVSFKGHKVQWLPCMNIFIPKFSIIMMYSIGRYKWSQ